MKRPGILILALAVATPVTLAACSTEGPLSSQEATEAACEIILDPTSYSGDTDRVIEDLERYGNAIDDVELSNQLELMVAGIRGNDGTAVNEAAESAAELCLPDSTISDRDTEDIDSASSTILTEDEALELLASLSSDATSEQWRSIAQGVCDEYDKEARPLDEDGAISIRVAETITSSELFRGTGDTTASIPGASLQAGHVAVLLVGSTELKCPEWTTDSQAFATTALEDY